MKDELDDKPILFLDPQPADVPALTVLEDLYDPKTHTQAQTEVTPMKQITPPSMEQIAPHNEDEDAKTAPAESDHHADAKWPCPTCTYLNDMKQRNCEMCDTGAPPHIAKYPHHEDAAPAPPAPDAHRRESCSVMRRRLNQDSRLLR